MNSQGVAMIIWAVTSAKNAGGNIVFSGFSESIKKVLEITRINTLLSCYDNLDEALDSFKGNT
jgi:anti-anti-sigma regulatory factor